MDRRTYHSRRGRRDRAGFTLIELLVVLLIVSIIAAVTLPVVIPAISHRQVSESARIIQGGLVAARDSALRSNTPHGIRFLPDPTLNGTDPAVPGRINPFKTLASNRFIPIERPPGYSEGKVYTGTPSLSDPSWWANDPLLASGMNARPVLEAGRVLLLIQSVFAPNGSLEPPTSWYWNIRVGDRVRLNGQGRVYTVVGPVQTQGDANPQNFVNIGALSGTLALDDPGGGGTKYYPEVLFLTDGLDGDSDGYVDNGWDGLDNDANGSIDDVAEWSETESWPKELDTNGAIGSSTKGIPYQIIRQPVPSPGARETILPESVVVDLTGWNEAQPERSRLPVDPRSGTVDLLLEPNGRVIPTTHYSSPSSFGMNQSFYHVWVAERTDLAEIKTTVDTNGKTVSAPLVSGGTFVLPMPLGRNLETDAGGPNSYDALVNSNATLPYLKGEMRLLSLSTRTGNLMTTDRPVFSVLNPSQPFHAPQLGEQGDAP